MLYIMYIWHMFVQKWFNKMWFPKDHIFAIF